MKHLFLWCFPSAISVDADLYVERTLGQNDALEKNQKRDQKVLALQIKKQVAVLTWSKTGSNMFSIRNQRHVVHCNPRDPHTSYC